MLCSVGSRKLFNHTLKWPIIAEHRHLPVTSKNRFPARNDWCAIWQRTSNTSTINDSNARLALLLKSCRQVQQACLPNSMIISEVNGSSFWQHVDINFPSLFGSIFMTNLPHSAAQTLSALFSWRKHLTLWTDPTLSGFKVLCLCAAGLARLHFSVSSALCPRMIWSEMSCRSEVAVHWKSPQKDTNTGSQTAHKENKPKQRRTFTNGSNKALSLQSTEQNDVNQREGTEYQRSRNKYEINKIWATLKDGYVWGGDECAQKCSRQNVKVDASVASALCFTHLVAPCDNYNYVTLYAPPPISYRQVFYQCSTHRNHSASSQILIHFLLSRCLELVCRCTNGKSDVILLFQHVPTLSVIMLLFFVFCSSV